MAQRRLFKHGFVLLALVALVMAPAAQAHVAEGGAGSVMAGLLHPVTGLDHVVAMVAVGLWGAVLGMPAVWLLPVAFPMVMAFGGLAGMVGLPLPGVETGIALSALVLGVMVMLQQRLPLMVAAGLVGAVRPLSWLCPWPGVARWSGCSAVQPRFCGGDWLAALGGYCSR